MQPFKVLLNPGSRIHKGRRAKLIRQRLDRTASKKEVLMLVAEIGPLPPAII